MAGVGSQSPNQREGLSAVSSITGNNEYVFSTNHSLNVNITGGGAGGTQYIEGATTSPATGTVALGRYLSSAPTLTNGQLYTPQLDINGNLKVNIVSGGSGGTQYTNGTAVASGSAIGGLALGYDGTNVRAMRTDAAGDAYSIITDSITTANVSNISAGTAAGENALKTTRGYREIIVSGNAIGSLLAGTDVSQYSWVSIHITGTFTATYSFRGSNDNVNVSGVSFQNLGSSTLNPQVSSTATNSIFTGPLNFRYLSIPITAYTSGTLTATIELYTIAPAAQTVGATVASQNATAIAIPSVAFPQGINSGGLLVIPAAANTNADGASGASITATASDVYNGTTFDRVRSVANATNTTGTGIMATGILAQFDDVTPTSITENQFGNIRISANRNLYGTIRDAAGNERGANVTATNALVVDGSAVTQPISGTVTANPGALPSAIVNGQKAASTSAAALGTGALTQGVIVEALSTNTVSVFLGGTGVTASTGIELLPGASTSVAVSNISAVFIISATGTPSVSWIGS